MSEEHLFSSEDCVIRRKVIQYLSGFITEPRLQKIFSVLAWRTRYATVVVEDLFQTQNISAVLRTCECYGIQDVHIIENENEFQVHHAISMGANKWLSLHHYNNHENNAVKCIAHLKEKGYTVVATLPNDNSLYLDELPVDEPTAFLFGTELKGLSPELIALADKTVKIPMYGFTESFNISNSVAIILSDFVKKIWKSNLKISLSEEEKEILLLEWLQKSIKMPHLLIEDFLQKNHFVI
jgi:tRNA (guanosine-2'-O-)-methyltransferase